MQKIYFKSHPWHGVSYGKEAPNKVTAFVEITPNDTIKYEIDKDSGYLKIDRPQRFSNVLPALYGFIPRSYCGENVANRCINITQRNEIIGDGDPLDICILTEKNILHGDILVNAIPIGGLRMIDGNEADDKIIAVLDGDMLFNNWKEMDHLPENMKDRLLHYFLTYKEIPYLKLNKQVEIVEIYGREEAYKVIEASFKDYENLMKSSN